MNDQPLEQVKTALTDNIIRFYGDIREATYEAHLRDVIEDECMCLVTDDYEYLEDLVDFGIECYDKFDSKIENEWEYYHICFERIDLKFPTKNNGKWQIGIIDEYDNVDYYCLPFGTEYDAYKWWLAGGCRFEPSEYNLKYR